MGAILHPAAAPRMPAVTRILSRYDRNKLEAFISVAIDLLDTLDGQADPDTPDFARRSDGLAATPDNIEQAMSQIVGHPERVQAIRATIEASQAMEVRRHG